MIKNMINVFFYDIKRVLSKKIFYFLLILIVFILTNRIQQGIIDANEMKTALEARVSSKLIANCWDNVYDIIFIPGFAEWVILPFMLYLTTYIFFDNQLNMFIKIRMEKKIYWFISKIFLIFILSFSIILTITLITVVISTFYSGFSLNWSSFIAEKKLFNPMFGGTVFYSPIMMVILNSISYASSITILSVIAGLLSLRKNNPKVGIIFSIIFLLIGKATKFLSTDYQEVFKYITLDNYTNFANKTFLKADDINGLGLLTVRESFIILGSILTIVTIFSIFYIKKVDFSIGEKQI